MHAKAFVITGEHVQLVANDNCDFRYHASSHHLPVGAQVAVRSHERAETHFMIVDGMIEFMVGGASRMVFAGEFVRVPVGVVYAYRNAGDGTATVLLRQINAGTRSAMRVAGYFAA